MKKYLIPFFVMVCIAGISFAEEEVKLINMNPSTGIPKWEEFCEPGYANVKKTDRNDILNIFSFVKAERVKRNYWAGRRTAFENYLNYCQSLPSETEKSSCYSDLRKAENEKNVLYKEKRNFILYENNRERHRY